jgi:hypothetical protein
VMNRLCEEIDDEDLRNVGISSNYVKEPRYS